MPRYKDPLMQKAFDGCLAAAADRNSELYRDGDTKRRGAGQRCAFWDGFDGKERSPHAPPQTFAWACFQAGKEWAKHCKKEGIAPPKEASDPLFAIRA